jgi:HD-GYP domain-containing protein (c-di-GMP phosphodiesterase class II)
MVAAEAQKAPTARRDSGYVQVLVGTLRCLAIAPVDVFVQNKSAAPPLLYCRAGYPLASTQFLGLADAGVHHVFVRAQDFRSFGADLLDSVESLLQQEAIPRTERFAALQAAVSVELEHTARLVDNSKFVALAEKVGRNLVALLAANDVLPHELFVIARHDFRTFTHVTNVASYSVILAERLGISQRQELDQIAVAAMLHDIGKRFIPAGILTKPGRLNSAERATIELHPQRGYEELQQRLDLSYGQLMVVYQHHELIDGTGYPVGITGEEMHPWAKLVAVVDVFDAMTGSRPYRRPASASFALDYIRQHAGTHFDPEAAACWISAMSQM